MRKTFLTALAICGTIGLHAQQIFKTNSDYLQVKVNNVLQSDNWTIGKNIDNGAFEAEMVNENNIVTYSDGKNSISFDLKLGQQIDFLILKNGKDTINQQLVGVAPNANFSEEYIANHKGKSIVAIPEVSELVNIIMALHPDAEKEANMFGTSTAYYQRVKKHFEPYLNHPALDTIKKYITDLDYVEQYDVNLFSRNSYNYYYALKMTACGYHFDENGNIVNDGNIQEIGKKYYDFNPMKDIEVFEDFARKSNFREFYKENQPYYNSLLATYNQLNPIQKMQTWLDAKFGFSYNAYLVYFSPLIGGAHSTRSYQSNGFKQTLMFICRAEYNDAYSKIQNELLESRVVFTEIDHNYVNPISDKFLDKINQALSNREVWTNSSINNASYGSPYKVFNEYMTFAVYSLYLNDNYKEKDVKAYLPTLNNQMENARGFSKFTDFDQTLLAKYKANPNIKIEDLYEYILDWCTEQNRG
ncbi:MAG TPA: DUF4932 domain-containing protein [Flavobacterium sp.]|nr:DUF4932 domain-containing protein [Flavobacterium sp.]